MAKNTLIIFILLLSTAISAEQPYVDYKNEAFKYKAFIPAGWEKSEFDLTYKHVLKLKKDKYTEIRVTATAYTMEELEKWNDWKQWYTDKIGKNIWEITETENFRHEENITGKLIVFQYETKCGKMLQRILISRTKDFIYIVECGTALGSFGKYTEVFNTVMGSINSLE